MMMTVQRLVALFLCILLALIPCAFAENETPEAQIARLQAELEEKNTRIAELEARISALEAQISPGEYSPQDAAAEFHGGIITIEDALAEYEYRAYYYEMFGMSASEYAADLKDEVLRDLVEDAILEQKAREFGVYELDEDTRAQLQAKAQSQMDELVEYYRVYREQEGMTEEEILQDTLDYLAEEGYSLESILQSLTAETWRDRLYAHVTENTTVSQEELQQYYQDLLASQQMLFSSDFSEYDYAQSEGTPILWNPEGVRAIRFVLVGFGADIAEEHAQLLYELEDNPNEEALSRMENLYASLSPISDEVSQRAQAGDDFLLLIDEYSADATFDQEPWRSHGICVGANSIAYEPDVIQAAMSLENVGDISQPVKTDDGLIILQYLADVAPGAVPFEQAQSQLQPIALQEKMNRLYNDTVEQWIADANVHYYPERF